MSFIDSISDKLFYSSKRDYNVQEGNVAYLDTAPLRRPFTMPAAQRTIMIILIIAALIVGIKIANDTVFASIREAADQQQVVENNLKRQSSLETLPAMGQLATLNDGELFANFQQAGYTIYNATQPNEAGDLTLYKVPSDMTLDEAAKLYAKGINGLNAAQATKLLNGSWRFGTDKVGGGIVVHYADFSTADPKIAVQNALQKEGFGAESVTDQGVDESGNTYSTGTINVGEKTYTWKISALPLSDIYSINGMPENACYVGIRVTAA